MAVYDCFPFFNENDLLEIRINQHWDFVDKFIITEAGETHTGKPKPFNFDHERFEQYKSKVIYRTFDSFETEIAENKTCFGCVEARTASCFTKVVGLLCPPVLVLPPCLFYTR